ncbi:MAG: hypothetical protein WCQ95_13600 [Bacteroidota bacterium]
MRTVSKLFAIAVTFLLMFQFGVSKAQDLTLTNTPDARLYEAFGNDRVAFLKQNNPDLIGYYNFFLDNAFTITQHPVEKIAGIITSCPLLKLKNGSLTIDKPDMVKGTKSINILKYLYKIEQNKTTQYRLDDSGIVIVFYPAKYFTEKYNKARNL